MFTGLITAAVALGVGQLVAGIVSPPASPVVAVGEAAIDRTPPPLKNFAINAFGSHDKTVLVAGILVLLAVFAAAFGVAAMRRLSYGLAGLAVFTGVGLIAALTRPTASASYAIPVLVGGAAGAVTMVLLVRAAHGGAAAVRGPEPAALETPGPSAGPPASAQPGASWVPARSSVDGAPQSAASTPDSRRQFLVTGSVAVAVAGASALVGRGLAERTSVSQALSALRLPKPVTALPPLKSGVDLGIPGLSSFVTPNSNFYRVDTAIVLPQVAPSS